MSKLSFNEKRMLERGGRTPDESVPISPAHHFQIPVTGEQPMSLEEQLAAQAERSAAGQGSHHVVGPDRHDPVLCHHLRMTPTKRAKTAVESLMEYRNPNAEVIS